MRQSERDKEREERERSACLTGIERKRRGKRGSVWEENRKRNRRRTTKKKRKKKKGKKMEKN